MCKSNSNLKGGIVITHLTQKIKQELRTGTFNNNDYLLNAEDTAEMLSCSLAYVYVLAQLGKLSCVRWPCEPTAEGKRPRKMLRFLKSDVLEFINNNKLPKI